MNIKPLLMPLGECLGLEIAPNKYTGTAAEYVVFNYADDRPAGFADNTDFLSETAAQVHIFTRQDTEPLKIKTRQFLRKKGFTIESTQEFYENDTKLTHVVVECFIIGDSDDLQEE